MRENARRRTKWETWSLWRSASSSLDLAEDVVVVPDCATAFERRGIYSPMRFSIRALVSGHAWLRADAFSISAKTCSRSNAHCSNSSTVISCTGGTVYIFSRNGYAASPVARDGWCTTWACLPYSPATAGAAERNMLRKAENGRRATRTRSYATWSTMSWPATAVPTPPPLQLRPSSACVLTRGQAA